MRILHLTLAADQGGLTRYITTLSAALLALGHQVSGAGDAGPAGADFAAARVPYIRVPLKQGFFGMRQSARELRGWLLDHEIDLIHTHYRRATILARRLQRGLRRLRHVPILYTLHLSHIEVGGWRRLIADWGDHTHAPSRDAAQWLAREAGVPQDRISVIPHGIAVERFPQRTPADRAAARARLSLPPGAPVIAYVGRLEHPKNALWCAQVLASAHREMPDLHLLYAGDGPDRPPIEDFAVRQRIAQRVRFLGYVDPLPTYQAADLLVLPSEREGFSLACAEAMSVGLPHVRTRTSGTTELTVENRTGISVEIDRTAFITATLRALSQPELLARMGEEGARLIREQFTFDRQLAQTIALYRRLIDSA